MSLAGTILLSRAAVVLARSLGVSADIDKRSLVTVGLCDPGNLTTLAGSHTLDVDFTGTLLALLEMSDLSHRYNKGASLTVPQER